VLPLLVLLVDTRAAFSWEVFFLNLVIAHILLINVYNIVVKNVITFRPEVSENVRSLRSFLRPAALALPLLYMEYGRSAALYTIGLAIIVSLAVDVIRARGEETVVSSHRNLYFVYRLPESLHVHISSSTAFLIACFLTILFFDQRIALAAIVFLIFGDMFAKSFGLQYGRTRLLTKTVEGSLACLAACLMVSFFLAQAIEISPLILVGGAFCATLAELLPIGVNDNFTIPLFSGGGMFLIGSL
jgi:dolichol kinase